MNKDAELYVSAAKIIAMCPANRLDLVLDVLKMGGLESEKINEALANAKTRRKKTVYDAREHDDKRDLWIETDDEVANLLRDAYDKNVSMSAISKMTGIHKVSLYRYLRGENRPSKVKGDMITAAVNKIFKEIDGEDE